MKVNEPWKDEKEDVEYVNADLTLEEAQFLVLLMGKFVENTQLAKDIWEALQLEAGIEPLDRQITSINVQPILVME